MYNQSTSNVCCHFRHCLNTSRTTGYEPGVAELLIRLPTSPSQRFLKATLNLSTAISTASKLLNASHHTLHSSSFFTHLTPSQKLPPKTSTSEGLPEDSFCKSFRKSSLSHCANPANPSHLKLGRLQTVLTPRHSLSCES